MVYMLEVTQIVLCDSMLILEKFFPSLLSQNLDRFCVFFKNRPFRSMYVMDGVNIPDFAACQKS